ncbi:hypothetical protein CKM354_000512300 [Cercospora kikuchii]|uniref:F-box domain-containing protein n=1 Tax=Cercospora kikuchii TaxID=84275 RepID=A0A9P3CEN6_9PEZI|nr:uncharacterized protein CKM354_000512300 [Cercospora kikuchii]GIZ41832.1 hypothetical protein CKM354_000512300 [Cercospora kikuchii]
MASLLESLPAELLSHVLDEVDKSLTGCERRNRAQIFRDVSCVSRTLRNANESHLYREIAAGQDGKMNTWRLLLRTLCEQPRLRKHVLSITGRVSWGVPDPLSVQDYALFETASAPYRTYVGLKNLRPTLLAGCHTAGIALLLALATNLKKLELNFASPGQSQRICQNCRLAEPALAAVLSCQGTKANRHIKSIVFGGHPPEGMSFDWAGDLLHSLPGIQRLVMNCLGSIMLPRSILRSRPMVKELSFHGLRVSAGRLATLLNSCMGLESLSVSWTYMPFGIDFHELSRSIKRHAATLHTLRLSNKDHRSRPVIPFLGDLASLQYLEIDDHILTGREPWVPGQTPLAILPPQLQHLDMASEAPVFDLQHILEELGPHLENLACIRVKFRRTLRQADFKFGDFMERKELRHGVRFREDKPWLLSCCARQGFFTFDCARTCDKSVRESCQEVAAELANNGMTAMMSDYFSSGRLAYRPQLCCHAYEKEITDRYARLIMDMSYITSPDQPAGEASV